MIARFHLCAPINKCMEQKQITVCSVSCCGINELETRDYFKILLFHEFCRKWSAYGKHQK